jgi:hypothetical protein
MNLINAKRLFKVILQCHFTIAVRKNVICAYSTHIWIRNNSASNLGTVGDTLFGLKDQLQKK